MGSVEGWKGGRGWIWIMMPKCGVPIGVVPEKGMTFLMKREGEMLLLSYLLVAVVFRWKGEREKRRRRIKKEKKRGLEGRKEGEERNIWKICK